MSKTPVPMHAPTPRQRPMCPECNRRLRPMYAARTGEKKQWTGEYHAWGHFCTVACAVRWANRMFDRLSGGEL